MSKPYNQAFRGKLRTPRALHLRIELARADAKVLLALPVLSPPERRAIHALFATGPRIFRRLDKHRPHVVLGAASAS